MILEICANSYQSALNAQNAGANRIELCSELSVGGITPSHGLLQKIAEKITIPVHVLVRPRSGNFFYSKDEFEQIKKDIKICKDFGFQGIVCAVLHSDNTIDIERTKELVELSKPLSFTFHRAFDCVPNPKKEILNLIDLGVNRVLTSGQKEKAIDGIELLKQLKEITENKIIILPGSGINSENVTYFKKAGFQEIHTSASKKVKNQNNVFFDKTIQTISDVTNIQEILKNIRNA